MLIDIYIYTILQLKLHFYAKMKKKELFKTSLISRHPVPQIDKVLHIVTNL